MARRAQPNVWKFCLLGLQAALLFSVFHLYQIENIVFDRVVLIAFGSFAIHYWLPFRLKEPFLVGVSLVSALYLLGLGNGGLVLGFGLIFFLVARVPIAFRWRALIVTAMFAALIYGNAAHRLPAEFPAAFGGIFMFRSIIYMYEMRHSKEPARLLPFLAYFFILPNYCFPLFPVVDFKTMRRTYYQRDIHEIVQRGLVLMLIGVFELAMYRIVFYYNDQFVLDRIDSLGALVATMVLTFLMILRVVGQFQISIGMLHLFGYDLPDIFRHFLLSSSLTDFWRRTNIYWKDFMVKVVYFPMFFGLRKRGALLAQVIATVAVFIATWLLHAYQAFWLAGRWGFRWTDSLFWLLFGGLFLVTMLCDHWRESHRIVYTGWRAGALHVTGIVSTFSLITFLWYLWSAPTLERWKFLMTYWRGGHG
jgi:D-alanyl-lipoteichoic acid acyltransferase DltB (MBOAT superfamily)